MRILVATGGAPHSMLAVRFAGILARDLRAHLTILTVVKNEREQASAERILDEASTLMRQYIPTCEVRIRVGHPAHEIITEAEERQYDLIVIGERQHHTLATRFLLGATAERVIEHAPCPVVVAKGKIAPIRKILICSGVRTDDSLVDRAVAQLEPALALATTLTVLHVMSQVSTAPEKSGHTLQATAEELIAEESHEGQILTHDKVQLLGAGIEPALKVRHGLVVEEILNEARVGNYNIIVIGAHQGGGWRRILLDDLTHQVLVGADRPVLVIR